MAAAADLQKRRRPTAAAAKIRLLCSYGGRILPRPVDHQLRYAGGETRLIVLPRSLSFSLLHFKLSKLAEISPFSTLQIKYQLPHEDLDSLISVSCDEDVEIMMEEYDRAAASGDRRFRVFLFQSGGQGPLNERWLEDSLRCGGVEPPPPLPAEPTRPAYLVPDRPVGVAHMSYGGPVQPGPRWMTQTGPILGLHRGLIGSINPTVKGNAVYGGSMDGINRM